MPGGPSVTGWTNWPRSTSTTSASRSSNCAVPARSRSPSIRCRSGRRPNMPRRTQTLRCGLWLRLKPRIAAEGASRVYERVDKPLVPVIARMERRGIKVDRDYLARLSSEFGRDIQVLEEKIYEAACGPFTIGSPQQLGQVLYERLGLKGGRKGKSGQYSTDVNELERLAAEGVSMRVAGARVAPADEAQIDLHRRAAGGDQSADRAGPHQLLADRRADGTAVVERSQPAEHPDPHRGRPQDSRRLRRRAGVQIALAPTTARSSFALLRTWRTCRSSRKRSGPVWTSTA